MSKGQLVASVALGTAFGVLAATMPVKVGSGFEETQAAISQCLDTDFSVDGSEVESGSEATLADMEKVLECNDDNYSYVLAQNVESDQIDINEAVNLIIENSN